MSQNSIHACPTVASQYKKAVDVSSIVSKTDTDGIITYVNDKFLNVSGYKEAELLGKKHSLISHPDTPLEVFDDLWSTIISKKTWSGQIKNLKKDGSSYTVSSTIIPIVDRDDNIIEFISIRQDITQLLEQENIIQKQTTDSLTALPNREKLIQDLSTTTNPNLALINLKNFRDVNELYGFDIGDKVIIQVAKLIKEFFSTSKCSVYKLPSDEFAILLDSDKEILHFQEKILSLMNKIKRQEIILNAFKIRVSSVIGVSNSKINTLMNADLALQNAKQVNKTHIFNGDSSKTQEQLNNNLTWHGKIRDAIEENRVVPFYQPIYNPKTKRIQKYETLVRIIDENQKVISPYHFLDIAKKYSQYEHITKIMILSSFEYFRDKPYQFSINLSVEDILNDNMVEYIIQNIKNFNEPNRIIFEITESEGIENYSEVREFIKEIKSFGCKIAIDDFGAGYSNFDHIIQLNVDYLKIDGSLVRNIDTNWEARVVVETIINFAKKLGIATITEYVHNKEIYNIVNDLGTDYIQGYYIGEPEEKIKEVKNIMKKQLSQKSIGIIKGSASLVTAQSTKITQRIYEILFTKYPQSKQLFKNAPENQYILLAEAISAYAVNIDKLHIFYPALEIIAQSHVKENIKPIHYPMLGMVFIEAIEDILGTLATIEFVDAWRESYQFLSDVLIEMETNIYEKQRKVA